MSVAAFRADDCIITSAGIDWVTLTTTSQQSKERFSREFNRHVARDLRDGYAINNGGFSGFVGKRTRHALLAEKEGRVLLRLSSDGAASAAVLAAPGDHCTRLDVQFTIRLPAGTVPRWLAQQERCCGKRRTLRGKRPPVDSSRRDGQVYQVKIGSRQSEVYTRLYDKFLESKDEAYRNCVRLEIEYKGEAASRRWEALASHALTLWGLLLLLLQDLTARGVDTGIVDMDRQDICLPKPEPLKEHRTWGWWASQVAPSVAKSVAERGWYTAFHILFGNTLTEWDKTAIMNSLSLQWGN